MRGATINLTNTLAGGVWSSSNTAIATVSGTGVVTGIAAGAATITYTVTNGSGCSAAQQVTINVNALPAVSITSGVNAVCTGSNVTMTATPAGGTGAVVIRQSLACLIPAW
ncbi:Ig-like domain-containing protein [Chitinophaga sedimenti]|uniref:Ig-like domain-containing protein n=1 Tax=Chitinophaga sedimenti TaxID=2033606 RepID=UPI002003300C|nr:Ig-like domain-containing protein [Chitinophaga sedimenti]MCK7558362.1 Ig-like domain-containing protein [Chitinophaga sedimenti]